MTPADWSRIKEIFGAASELPPAAREEFVRQQAGSNEELLREVLRLLSLHEDGDDNRAPGLRSFVEAAARLRVFYDGETLAGRYIVRRFLAEGGMGEVYEAEDLELGHRVALKTLRPEIAGSDHVVFLRRENQAARKIDHPNVCRAYDLVQTTTADGRPLVFLTMELIEGETLSERLRRDGPMSERQALPIVRQMIAGLAAAHRARVVHRDFKTGNVMLAPRPGGAPRVVITDFGLARPILTDGATMASTARSSTISMGTPAYIAPEQIQGAKPGPPSDIYALGVVLFEMLTGGLPFEDESPLQMAISKIHKPPRSLLTLLPTLRPNWNRAILRCLNPNPAKRFQNAGEVLEALEIRTRPGMWRRRFVRRKQAYLRGVAIGLGMLLLVLLTFKWWPARPSAAASLEWEAGVAALHAGEPATAAARLEQAIHNHRLPLLAQSQLAMAWFEAGFPQRAEKAIPFPSPVEPPADRFYKHAVQALLANNRGLAELILKRRVSMVDVTARAGAGADLALLHAGGTLAEWQTVIAERPQYAPALMWIGIHQAKAGQSEEAQAAFLAAETYFQARKDSTLARLVSARRGLANLAAGNTELARQDLPGLAAFGLRPGLGYGTCQRVIVLTAGVADNFQLPPDPVEFVSERLRSMPARQGAHGKLFDDRQNDQEFMLSIPLPAIPLCDATLQVKVGRTDMAGSSADMLIAGVAPFASKVVEGNIWTADPAATTRVMNQPVLLAIREVLKETPSQQAPFLDILIGDDTFVDYVKLILVY